MTMKEDVFKISFISTDDCFFYLSDKILSEFTKKGGSDGKCIEIKFGPDLEKCIYGSLSGRPLGIKTNRIGVNAVYAELLGIREHDEVLISLKSAPMLTEARILPLDESDYKSIEYNRSHLENSLLNNIKVITVGTKFSVKIINNIVVNLEVVGLNSNLPYGQLHNGTELTVLNPSEIRETDKAVMGDCYNNSILSWITDILTGRTSLFDFFIGNNETSDARHALFSTDEVEEPLPECDGIELGRIRIAPLLFAPKEIQKMTPENLAFAVGLPIPGTNNGSCCFKCKIELLSTRRRGNRSKSVEVACCSRAVYQSTNFFYVPDHVMVSLNAKFGSVIVIKEMSQVVPLLESTCPRPLTKLNYGCHTLSENCEKIYKNVANTVLDNIMFNQKINSLIIGDTGSGKTFLVELLKNFFNYYYLTTVIVDCKSLRKLKMSNLESEVAQKLSECCIDQPSLMIFDDLDALTMEDEEGVAYSSMYSARVGALIVDIITSCQRVNNVFFIATASSLVRLKDMSTDRGPIAFENIHEITELTSSERAFLLGQFVSALSVSVDKSVIEYVANKTKGYNVQDLADLVKIAEFKCLAAIGEGDQEKINREHFDLALTDKVPLSLQGVNLQKKSLTRFEDIGGMDKTKELLKEMLEWPVKYHEVYKSCPLRVQCGILLYGAPGTGKTLIAGAVSNEFGLNFISIKGPEIFSKYVGASEQGIRDLFARAKRAKPCLLFFDEFDSLARRRGSSNEDVNDRVVNQLLTELDGVEELTGVFILAATSRPDLLDPALLRPGRMDKVVHCKLPDEAERLEILNVLSKDMKLLDDVKLEEIAAKTDGYSGADLRAILYAAQATLIKEIRTSKDADTQLEIALKYSHIITGLNETKPSISEEDRRRYSSSYEDFIRSRSRRPFRETGKSKPRVMFA